MLTNIPPSIHIHKVCKLHIGNTLTKPLQGEKFRPQKETHPPEYTSFLQTGRQWSQMPIDESIRNAQTDYINQQFIHDTRGDSSQPRRTTKTPTMGSSYEIYHTRISPDNALENSDSPICMNKAALLNNIGGVNGHVDLGRALGTKDRNVQLPRTPTQYLPDQSLMDGEADPTRTTFNEISPTSPKKSKATNTPISRHTDSIRKCRMTCLAVSNPIQQVEKSCPTAKPLSACTVLNYLDSSPSPSPCPSPLRSDKKEVIETYSDYVLSISTKRKEVNIRQKETKYILAARSNKENVSDIIISPKKSNSRGSSSSYHCEKLSVFAQGVDETIDSREIELNPSTSPSPTRQSKGKVRDRAQGGEEFHDYPESSTTCEPHSNPDVKWFPSDRCPEPETTEPIPLSNPLQEQRIVQVTTIAPNEPILQSCRKCSEQGHIVSNCPKTKHLRSEK